MSTEENGGDVPEQHSTAGKAPSVSHTPSVPLSTDAGQGGVGRLNLSARERDTAEGLEQFDKHLAGLYRLGLELCPHAAEPGVAYLIAHAGRELGLGVVRLLSDMAPALTDAEIERVSHDENYRGEIARMLGVAPDHASVTIWFGTQRTLVRAAHFRMPAPAPDAVRDAFLRLSGLLFGRVAPYFSTHAELEALLTINVPSPEQLARVRELLLRPVQRHHFFGRLEHPAWLHPLAEAGYFNAPNTAIDAGGMSQPRPWPEGEFLVRVSSADPEKVVELLLAIPPENQNPIVCDVLVRAALALPVVQARRLVPAITRAISALPSGHFLTHRIIDLARTMAEAGEARAFELAESLLWLASKPPSAEMVEVSTLTDAHVGSENAEDESASYRAALARALSRGRRNNEWMLMRLDAYGLSQFIEKAVPALEALDAARLLELLMEKLQRAVHLGRADLAEISVVDADGAAHPVADPSDDSEYWADDLNHADEAGDVREQLAVALARVASRAAARDADGAQFVDGSLARRHTDVFTRIRLVALRAAREFAPRSSINALVSDPMVIDPPFRAREVAAFLRAQFEHATFESQRQFLANLERGPEPDLVKRMVEFRHGRVPGKEVRENGVEPRDEAQRSDDAAPNDIEARGAVADWQRVRLRWFHDRIPEVLAPLAVALDVNPQVPSAQDQALDEVGSWSSGVSSVGYRSPKSPDAMAAMSPEEVVEYLRTWQPDAGVLKFSGPSPEGLQQALSSYVTQHPASGAALAQLLPRAGVAPGYVGAVLTGFEALADGSQPLPWRVLVALFEFVLSEADGARAIPADIVTDAGSWHGAVYSAVDLLRKACATNAVPEDSREDVWRVAEEVIRSPVTWSEPRSSVRTPRSGAEPSVEMLGDLEFAALNSLPGHAVRMLVDVALWDYRRLERGEESAASNARTTGNGRAHELCDVSDTARHLVPLLDSILGQSERPGRLALAMLGDFIPQIVLVARPWVVEHADALFGGGAVVPSEHPTWGMYLAHGGFYELVFQDLRPWYVRAADSAPDPTPGSEHSDWSVSRNLAVHTILAAVRGAAAVGDQDQLVELVFARVRVEERTHAYWVIFRNWSDAKGALPEAFVRRLVAFWEWRVSVLEAQPESKDRADEADGLGWFLLTPHVPAADAIRLGLRTFRLSRDNVRTAVSAWERLDKLAQHDPIGTFELAELLARRALAGDYPYLPFQQVSPSLRAALVRGDRDVRMRARRLINDLGDRGLFEFGGLLRDLGPTH